MAFDRPIEADRADDLGEGLLSSFLRATVWLLGGDQSQKDAEEDEKKEKDKLKSAVMEGGLESDNEDDDSDDDEDDEDAGGIDGKDGRDQVARTDDTGQSSCSDVDRGKDHLSLASNKENDESALEAWPQVGVMESDDDEADSGLNLPCKRKSNSSSTNDLASFKSSRSSSGGNCDGNNDRPATKLVDELVAVMEASSLSSPPSKNTTSAMEQNNSPASSALSASEASGNSLTGSYSASSFSSHQPLTTMTRHQSLNNFPSQSHQHQNKTHNSASNIRTKKMSWSDECGHRSLVEYFDESNAKSTRQHGHWSNARRNSFRSSRNGSFDGTAGNYVNGKKGETRVIKSALRRSGSYSPPIPNHYTYGSSDSNHSSSAASSSGSGSSIHSSTQGFKSFKSLSVIGSSCSSSSSQSSDSQRNHNLNHHDKSTSNDNEMQCVPSTLQAGCGQASGGLIIPRGGPGMGGGLAGYHLILGTGVPRIGGLQQQQGSGASGGKGEPDKDASAAPTAAAAAAAATVGASPNANGKSKAKGGSHHHHHHHHHQFIPHGNGYVSPQYGFYVNITPPTPEMYSRPPTGGGEKTSQSTISQPYQQFQYQTQYHHPSPIPEGRASNVHHHLSQQRQSPTPPLSSKHNMKQCGGSPARDTKSAAMQRSLKPTFTKNRKGMGMVLAGNTHHVWPTVPFG